MRNLENLINPDAQKALERLLDGIKELRNNELDVIDPDEKFFGPFSVSQNEMTESKYGYYNDGVSISWPDLDLMVNDLESALESK